MSSRPCVESCREFWIMISFYMNSALSADYAELLMREHKICIRTKLTSTHVILMLHLLRRYIAVSQKWLSWGRNPSCLFGTNHGLHTSTQH